MKAFIKSESGFNLIEVMIAMIIMAGAMVTLSTATSGNVMRMRQAKIKLDATALLDRKMTELLIQYDQKKTSDIPEEDSGDFGKDFPMFTWKMAAKPFDMPDPLAMYMAGEGEGGVDELTTILLGQMKDFINASITELQLTVIYKHPKQEARNFTIATYIANYEQSLNLPGASGGADGNADGGSTGNDGSSPSSTPDNPDSSGESE